MGWKQKAGIEPKIAAINPEVDKYLMDNGFELDTMEPRFMNNESNYSDIIGLGKLCLKLVIEDHKNPGYFMSIFINETEAYMEVQNSWRSFDRSYHTTINSKLDIAQVDVVLDLITNN